MATLNRRPLTHRSLQHISLSPAKSSRTVPGPKRPHSPDLPFDPFTSQQSSKRVKAVDLSLSVTRDKNRERRHVEREQQKAEFKDKYTRAFPTFTFYFEEDVAGSLTLDAYEDMIDQLGGRTVKFFDTEITHFISNRPVPNTSTSTSADKENNPKPISRNVLKSPIKLKSRLGEDPESRHGIDPLITAANLEKKIWNTTKLESVLKRLLDSPPSTSAHGVITKKQPPSLARLLKSEQIHGTSERDPTQKRHDFKYFTRGSKFVLVEDIRQELATISNYEYPVTKAREGVEKNVPWPVLHCHPQARGPFIPYDEKEKRRWEKLQKADKEKDDKEYRNRIKQANVMRRKAEANLHAKRTGDLRRSVSMNNLRRYGHFTAIPDDEHLQNDGDFPDSTNASGYLTLGTAGYMAASGNSVGITSTTGTTSTTGCAARSAQLPSTLSGRMKQHIVTSLKFTYDAANKENKVPLMGPPTVIPGKQPALRKSRSTNTFKLPKREEGCKPGYCESCRMKFDDFKVHIKSRKHQRFATDDANFLPLDCVLARVRRRTVLEVCEGRMKREAIQKHYCGRTTEEEQSCGDRTIQRLVPDTSGDSDRTLVCS